MVAGAHTLGLARVGVRLVERRMFESEYARHAVFAFHPRPEGVGGLQEGLLAVDADGFIRIDAQLRSVSHPQVLAVGDCASWAGWPLPKAGVHAVRMGPVLAHNLRVALGGPGGLLDHRPQRQFLALLATGDGRAIASRGPFGAEGAWAWRWKDRIDRAFIRRYCLN